MGKPKTPDPYETARAQTSENLTTATGNAWMQNPNIVTDDYTQSTVATDTKKIWDPNANGKGKGAYRKVPQFTTTMTLSPMQQAIKDQSDKSKLGIGQIANERAGFMADYLKGDSSYTPGEHEKYVTGLHDSIINPQIARNEELLRSRLAAQGLNAGNAAFNNEMQNFQTANQNARNQVALNSIDQGERIFRANRAAPLDELTQLLYGSQPNRAPAPSSNISGSPTTDIAGLVNQDYQNRLQRSQMMGSNVGGLLSGIGGLFALSDENAKKDISKVGKTNDGQAIYSYRYKGEPEKAPLRMGLMAQEVARRKPEAVMRGRDGLLRVNYRKALEAA